MICSSLHHCDAVCIRLKKDQRMWACAGVRLHVCVCERVCLCLNERAWACASHTHTNTPPQTVLFPMLSGRLWSHDHEAVPTAAMNHCIVEPPLDRRGEWEEEAGRAEGRDEEGWGGGEERKAKRCRRMQEGNKEKRKVRRGWWWWDRTILSVYSVYANKDYKMLTNNKMLIQHTSLRCHLFPGKISERHLFFTGDDGWSTQIHDCVFAYRAAGAECLSVSPGQSLWLHVTWV